MGEIMDFDQTFEKVKNDMIALGTYKPEFDDAIEIYAHMKVQYDEVFNRWVKGGMKSQVKSSGGMKRSPVVAQLEELRKQMITYSDRLGLTPKALDSIKNNDSGKKKTELEISLEKISGLLHS